MVNLFSKIKKLEITTTSKLKTNSFIDVLLLFISVTLLGGKLIFLSLLETNKYQI